MRSMQSSFKYNVNRHWFKTQNFRKARVIPPLKDGREANIYNKLDFVWMLQVRLLQVRLCLKMNIMQLQEKKEILSDN